MTKYKVEIQITLVAIIIAMVVFTLGHFSYKNLSQIVNSIQKEAKPDNKLFLIKNIAAELTILEHTLRLYILTNNDNDLEQYNTHQKNIILNLRKLNVYKGKLNQEAALTDSVEKFSMEKLILWHEVLTLHLSQKENSPSFSKIYSALEKTKNRTRTSNSGNNDEEQRIKNAETDTFLIERSPEFDIIKKKIKTLEKELSQKGIQNNILESQLIEKNINLGKKINALIAEAELRAENDFRMKTKEADRLAAKTYKWLSLFSFTTLILLLTALFVLFSYLKKSRIYQSALSEASEKAEKLARAKEQFVANVSHELRTPVNAIYGLTEQLLQKNKNNDNKEMISIVFKSAGHLKNIVNDTLDFSKIQSGKISFESVPFSPFALFEEIYTLQKYEADEKGIPVYLNWQGEKPETLIGDPLRLKQILINLISNAVKFTEKGEVKIQVFCSATYGKRYQLEIQIADTGIGMKKSDIGLIFDEYVQIKNETGKKYSGTGLGLSIVKKLVEMQNGEIKVESKSGKGTTVTVILNFDAGEKTTEANSAEELLKIPESMQKLYVLIADDEEYNLFLIKSIFQKWGIRYKEATNGNNAISSAQNEHFDVILMDLNMPGISGIEAAKTIMANDPKTFIIATTAANEPSEKQTCSNAGMQGFLLKPFSEKDLFEVLVNVAQPATNSLPEDYSQQIKFSELLHLANGDRKFLDEMIRLFIKSAETGISKIETEINAKNWDMVFENAHKLAAPAKHIGAKNLYDNIKKLEKLTRGTVDQVSVLKLFDELKNEITKLNQILTSYLQETETNLK